jgi:hypothetical protein
MRKDIKYVGVLFALLAMPAIVATEASPPPEPAVFAQASNKCADLSKLQIPGVSLVVSKAEWHAAGPAPAQPPPARPFASPLPAYCRLDGKIDQRTGADGKPYAIGFALALPDEWSGRFLFQGGGGLNGSVRPPYGANAAGEIPALARGFAVVSTDTGHEGTGAFDGSFFRDQQASLDFAYVAVGRVALLAKQIIAEYYRKPAERSYFSGCSTGGREAMLMAQRYPTYFDGVVSGAPAMRTGFSGIGDRWVAVTLNQIAPRDAAGKPIPSQGLSESDKKLIVDGLLNACDAKDGLKDGMIFNTRGCDFDPSALACTGAKTDACLTSQQASALKKAFAGPKDSKGNQVYAGFLYDTGITATGGIPGLLTVGPSPLGPPNLSTELDVDQEAARAAGSQARTGDTDSWTNLNTFSGHGGKLLFYHGVSDPWFSALDTVDYYLRMTRDNGGIDQARGWSRLFLAPGMGHCDGGSAALDKFDLLTAVVNWVEKGTPPDSVIATGKAFPGRTRPLCPYPAYAQYKGEGDIEDAKNFVCRT